MVLLLSMVGACDTLTPIEDYERSCDTAEDCTLVYPGCPNDACHCARAAINRGELERFLTEREASMCVGRGFGVACDCAEFEAQCVDGLCAAVDDNG